MLADNMTNPSMSWKLPLLDIRGYYTDPMSFVEELRKACHNVGFFLLRHDVPLGLSEQQMEEARQFFKQPLEKKLEISYEHSPAFRGYMKLGVENTSGKTDLREQVEFAQEAQGGKTHHAYYERLRGRNPWPSFQPSLQTVSLQYIQHVCRIADSLREAMCMALGLDKDALSSLFDSNPHWVLKLISYPPTTRESCSFGVGPHTDTNFLTLVLQDDVGGLQVYSEGQWMDVPFMPNVLVCNLGEQAEIWSQGYFLATPHRVLSSLKQRISIPLFYNPMLEATIHPLDSISSPWERSSKKHWRQEQNTMLTTVGENTFKSLARSHPQVFSKHHPDLLLLDDGRIVPRKEHL
jgi:isopenicillin N synthase-like dioxygenase